MSDTNILQLSDTIYQETIEDLRAKIESKFGSLKAFCDQTGIDRFNLYKVFNGYAGADMSIGLYSRIMTGLGVDGMAPVSQSNLSLRDYLRIDNNLILKSILLIKFT